MSIKSIGMCAGAMVSTGLALGIASDITLKWMGNYSQKKPEEIINEKIIALIRGASRIFGVILPAYNAINAESEKSSIHQSTQWIKISATAIIAMALINLFLEHINKNPKEIQKEDKIDNQEKKPPIHKPKYQIKDLVEQHLKYNEIVKHWTDRQKAEAIALGKFINSNKDPKARAVQLRFIFALLESESTPSEELLKQIVQQLRTIDEAGDRTLNDWDSFLEKKLDIETVKHRADSVEIYVNCFIKPHDFNDKIEFDVFFSNKN